MTAAEDLATQVRNHPEWYHTIEVAPDMVTPGWFDTRRVVDRVLLPPSLKGKRCLDIGTFDGFWAYEMERRGADEVVAIDVDDRRTWDWPGNTRPEDIDEFVQRAPQGEGFRIVHEAIGSQVQREDRSVYALDPSEVGVFDFVYMGSLLLHLRDPVGALEAVRSVCRGQLLVVDLIDLPLTTVFPRRPIGCLDGVGRPWWWRPNLACLTRFIEAAGFRLEQRPQRFFMPPGPGHPPASLRPSALRHQAGREAALRTRLGDPHAAVLARPIKAHE